MWLRTSDRAVNLETGASIVLGVEYLNNRPETARRIVRFGSGITLREPVRACSESEIIAWVKAYLGDAQKELQL